MKDNGFKEKLLQELGEPWPQKQDPTINQDCQTDKIHSDMWIKHKEKERILEEM